MRQFILLVGNNGTGKTYFSNNLPPDYIIIRPDEIPGGIENKQREMILGIEKGLKENRTVVVDGLNLQKKWRNNFLYFVRDYQDCPRIIYDFGPGDQHTLDRLLQERRDRSPEEWTETFYEHQKSYEKPTEDEGYEIREVRSDFGRDN
jgi:tRNA uridine 5-carbamoylmethylation protein Kti12